MITPFDIFAFETWILIGSVLFLCRWYVQRCWCVLKDLNIPHNPPSILGFGNSGDFMKNPDSMFTIDAELKKKFGIVYGSYTWLTPRICINDPDILKQVLIKEAGVFRDRQRTFSRINGKEMNTGMTVVSGDQWKRIRSTISPTFSASKMKDMFAIVDQCTDKLVESLQRKCENENGRFNLKDTFGKLSMDVICASAFGVNVQSQNETDSEMISKSKSFFTRNLIGPLTLIILLSPTFERIAEWFNYSMFDRNTISYYKRFINTMIKQKKAAKDTARNDILQGMLASEITDDDVKKGAVKGLTRKEIVANSITMMMAGFETTSSTITFFAYCTAVEQDVQEKLYQEILETIKEFGDLTTEAINSMKYLDMCFKESQRLYGVVPRNSRYTEVEITLKGITIPANTHVDIPVYALHHDEEYWEEPWKFIPERFEDMSKIDPMVFQPFGAGPRNCIGMRLAIFEVKMTIAKLLLNFKVDMCDDTPPPPLKITFRSSVQPKDDVNLRLTSRN